ncbi:hypothetical protein EDD22DRAFT_973863 [Suillus occidentalis]|nr:hypothetical protein EDD22DRAFT_973863 [Suillus occidentalis]
MGAFVFCSDEGRALCRKLLKETMPFDTHDYQLEVITHMLDGEDVLCTTATGSGKTDAFIRLMHVIIALSKNPSLAPGKNFPPDPAMLAICPTKALEYDLAEKMTRAKLTNAVINQDTVAAARKASNDNSCLFKNVCEGTAIILLSPEQLESSGFRYRFLSHPCRNVAKRSSDVEKREELNSDLIADVSKPESLEESKRKELDSDLFGYSGYDHHMEEGKREDFDSDLFWYIYDSRIAAGGEALGI